MSVFRVESLILSTILFSALIGCGSPTPTVNKGPPPPPPVPVVEAKPAPPPKPAPDPYEAAVAEIGTILKRYDAVFAGVRDEATSEKALQEIGNLTKRVRELAAEIAKMPYRPGQEKHTLALQNELTRLQTAQLSNPEMQRVLSDPDLQIQFLTAHQSFVLEGIGALGPAIMSRQQGAPRASDEQTPANPSKP